MQSTAKNKAKTGAKEGLVRWEFLYAVILATMAIKAEAD